MFEIDPSLYQTAYQKAQASVDQAQAALDKSLNERKRSQELEKRTPGTVPTLTLNNLTTAVDEAKANLDLAKANLTEAGLNLEYTKVVAPTDGFITSFHLQQGSHVVANSPVVALIDEHSFWVEGYFKETDLRHVHLGDEALVTLLINDDVTLKATVESIGFGIAKTDGNNGADLLPSVNPNFQWIRLAQRIPVKVKLIEYPTDIQLRVGMTASVRVITHSND